MFEIPSTGLFWVSVWPHSYPSFLHLISDLMTKVTCCLYLCVKAAPILCSARTERVHWQREEGPSPQQPEVTALLGGGHDGRLVGSQSARACSLGWCACDAFTALSLKSNETKLQRENRRSLQQNSHGKDSMCGSQPLISKTAPSQMRARCRQL